MGIVLARMKKWKREEDTRRARRREEWREKWSEGWEICFEKDTRAFWTFFLKKQREVAGAGDFHRMSLIEIHLENLKPNFKCEVFFVVL